MFIFYLFFSGSQATLLINMYYIPNANSSWHMQNQTLGLKAPDNWLHERHLISM